MHNENDIVARLRRHARVPVQEKDERKAAFQEARLVAKDENADILDRLRAIVVLSGGVSNSNISHLVQAADEIERLRKELDEARRTA